MWTDWKVYERGGAIFSALEPHTDWFKRRGAQGREYYNVDRAFFGFKDEHLYWCYGQPEYRDNGLKWNKRWITQGTEGSFFKAARERYAVCRKYLLALLDVPLPKDAKGLLARFDKIHELLLLHTRTLGIAIDAFDDYFSEVCAKQLRGAGYGQVVEDKEDWAILQQAAYRSVVMQYKAEIQSPNLRRLDLREIWKQYFWLTMGWSGTKPLSHADILKEMRKVKEKRVELLQYAVKIANARQAMIRKWKIPAQIIQPYLRVLDACARLHDERKEIQMRTLYAIDEVRTAAAKRYRVPMRDVQMLTVEETRQFIRTGKFPRAIVAKRRRGYCAKFEQGKIVFEKYGQAAWKAIDQELAMPNTARQEVKGVIASRGYAKGRAVVTDDPKEAMRLIRKGDILITSMTTPDFVLAMKKAGGVVTNEGGVTVHAAIMSREFGIPCITGTVHATHLFKTGDHVEVDAQRGMVRKL
ncbi:hypothetical protein HYW17_01230 [Candidatus Uhrbacteria bacterium]|nr:hypothetical protein [Candidatus Uhrbacteria bacterium]